MEYPSPPPIGGSPASWYTGAPITTAQDAAGSRFVAGNVLLAGNVPATEHGLFRVYRYSPTNRTLTEVPLPVRCLGRGIVSVNNFTGRLEYHTSDTAAKKPVSGEVPGAVPFAAINGGVAVPTEAPPAGVLAELGARVAALEAALNGAVQEARAARNEARGFAAEALRLRDLIGAVQGQVESLRGQKADVGGEVREIIWNTSILADRLYEDVKTDTRFAPTLRAVVRAGIHDWMKDVRNRQETDLLNLMWDRTVRLLRYKESKGLAADKLPVNDDAQLT